MSKTAAPLGILGDGQLALMLGESALAQGFDFFAFGDDSNSSFATRFPNNFIRGSKNDPIALQSFSDRCSVLTLENEFYSLESLRNLELNSHQTIIPPSSSYQFFENKRSQRKLYDSLSIPGAKTVEITSADPDKVLTQIEAQLQYPFVLKKSFGAYDGNGVAIIESPAQFKSSLQAFGLERGQILFAEEKINIQREFAQGALFDGNGGSNFLPLVETIQKNGICELVLSKSNLDPSLLVIVQTSILDYLDRISKAGLQGLFNFEFFLDTKNQVLINEGAPRPHNSQHLSLDASPLSQFDLLTSFCMNRKLPLPAGEKVSSQAGVMINLLGKSKGTPYELNLPPLPKELVIKSKLYLKKECLPGRKMGHLNLIDPSGKLDLIQIGERVLKEYQL